MKGFSTSDSPLDSGRRVIREVPSLGDFLEKWVGPGSEISDHEQTSSVRVKMADIQLVLQNIWLFLQVGDMNIRR